MRRLTGNDVVGIALIVDLKIVIVENLGRISEPERTLQVLAEIRALHILHRLRQLNVLRRIVERVNHNDAGNAFGTVLEPLEEIRIFQVRNLLRRVAVVDLRIGIADHILGNDLRQRTEGTVTDNACRSRIHQSDVVNIGCFGHIFLKRSSLHVDQPRKTAGVEDLCGRDSADHKDSYDHKEQIKRILYKFSCVLRVDGIALRGCDNRRRNEHAADGKKPSPESRIINVQRGQYQIKRYQSVQNRDDGRDDHLSRLTRLAVANRFSLFTHCHSPL